MSFPMAGHAVTELCKQCLQNYVNLSHVYEQLQPQKSSIMCKCVFMYQNREAMKNYKKGSFPLSFREKDKHRPNLKMEEYR